MVHFVFSYITWHYTRAIRDLTHNARNFLWFLFHFFSIGLLSKTLFAPWQKLGETYKRGFDISAFFETFVVNTIMRIVGFFIRLFVIIAGLIAILCAFALFCVLGVVWILIPGIVLILLVAGLHLILM